MRVRPRPQDGQEGETRRVGKLRKRIAEATRLRGLVRNPDLNAVEIERHRRRTLAGLWFFLALGLVFTSAGVQKFLAGKATFTDPLWWAAWTVEPMFAGLLIVLLNFEALILSHGIEPDHQWWSRLKRVLLVATLFMNVIPQLVPLFTDWDAFNPGSAFVHAIVPVIVYGLAEVIPVIQARARQAILQGYEQADQSEQVDQADHEAPSPQEGVPSPAEAALLQPRGLGPDQPPAPSPPQEPAPTQKSPTVAKRGPNLPPPMVKAVLGARSKAAAQGRELTVADVQAVINISGELAERIVADYTTNGHPVA
ncbi:hypothetical protein [Saccharopolyspora phatthalungensis]|uniref:DUF2637 domain-containing protein n=1 Tax=Saccharopolyspora phatthalungensis TaxID=664693 RepID=A0A840Q0I7_9PSEU|nr:hypothetical protein [Saccharopolyspora phatthalungensis]MBB5153031.1 hypothetical protein [Saccharopolyspora phatthalungensis]